MSDLSMECPSVSTLRLLCDSRQSLDGEKGLVNHVDTCDRCQSQIEQFDAAATETARELKALATVRDSQVLRNRLDDLKRDRRTQFDSQDSKSFHDLIPWIEPVEGALGRVEEYELVRFIGRGGMGIVLEAYDRKLRRSVALKFMSPALLNCEANSERFLREARSAAAINHPAVVSIFAVSQIRDLPFLVMELVDGECLQQRLDEGTLSNFEEICDIATQICDGLAAAHSKGVVHRDIKPANILIERGSGQVKLTDFGLARTTTDEMLTETGTLLGTPEFLAPEQVDSQQADYRTDLFSLGSVIHYMCVGEPPFLGATIASTLHAVATARPKKQLSECPQVPPALSDLVKALHSRSPEDRPGDASSVATSLRLIRAGKFSVTQQYRRTRKHSTSWLTYVAFALLIVASIGILATSVALLLDNSPEQESTTAESSQTLPTQEAEYHPQICMAKNSHQLAEYLEEHDGDLTIELVSDGPYLLDSIEVEDRAIEIYAEEDREPVIIFRLNPEDCAIRGIDAQVRLAGVRIEILESEVGQVEEEADLAPAISVSHGSLVLKDCAIIASSRQCIALEATDCELTDSTLETDYLAISYEPSESIDFTIESSKIAGETGIVFADIAFGSLHITNSVFEAELAIEFPWKPETQQRLVIRANDSHFASEAVLAVSDFEVEQIDSSVESLRDRLPFLWVSSGNTIPDTAVVLTSEGERERLIGREEWEVINQDEWEPD